MTETEDFNIQRQIAADVLTKAGDRAAGMRHPDGSQNENVDVEQLIQGEVSTALKRIFPSYGMLSRKGEQREEAEFMWVLDPIDGEKNYLRGLPLWGLSLALLRRNQAVVGVITIPDNHETYSANLDGKAYRNSAPVEVTKKRGLKDSVVAITWGKNGPQRERMLKAADVLVPEAADILSVGASSVALSWLAAGKVDAVVDTGDIWDFAAGFLIAKQMGAVVTEWDGSRPTYRERDFFTLVSTNQELHDSLVGKLRAC